MVRRNPNFAFTFIKTYCSPIYIVGTLAGYQTAHLLITSEDSLYFHTLYLKKLIDPKLTP